MADNFNLRQFLTENKLTKNAKLLSENTDISQAFSQAGITGEVTVAFYSEHGMSEPEFEVMNAQDALAMIASEAKGAEDVLIAQGDEIDQQGDLDSQTKGLECKLEVAILDHGTYEVYQGSNSLNEGKFSDSYKSQAAKDASYEIRKQIVNNLQSTKYEDLQGIVDKAIQATGEEVSPVEKAALLKHANWILTYNTGMEFEGVELDEAKSYKTSSNSKEVQQLKKGDILTSGDEVVSVSAGAKTPSGKVEVTVKTKSGKTKTNTWGKTTKVGVKQKETVKESTLSSREKYLTRLVENALGLENTNYDPDNEEWEPEDDYPGQTRYVTRRDIEEGEEMVAEKPLPKYENIEKLMQEIEHGTNEAAYKHKMNKMKEVAEMLETRVAALEEGEGAEFIDTKKVKQMKKDIMTLRKQAEKFEKEYDKKFGEKKSKKQTQTESKMENFNLKKFLTENKLTANSRMLSENTSGRQEVYYDDALFEIQAKYPNLETAIQGVKEYLDGGNGVVTFDTWEKAEVPYLEFDGPCYFLVGPDEEPGQHPPLLVSVRDRDLITDPKIVAQYKAEDAERM